MTPEHDSPTILVVDDSEDDFLLIKRQIQKVWPKAELLHTPDESALAAALATQPDLVICDYSMPQLTHDKAIELVQHAHPETPLILLSGLASDALGVQAMHDGVNDYVEKAKPERLIPAVRRELDTHRLRQDKKQLEHAHRKAAFFDASTGLLNRQGLEKALSGMRIEAATQSTLHLLSINLSKNQSRAPEIDPRTRRNALEKIIQRTRETFHGQVVCRWSDNLLVVVFNHAAFDSTNQNASDRLAELEFDLNKPFLVDQVPVRPNLRFGLARPGLDGSNAAELVSHAQAVCAVLEASNSGLFQALEVSVHMQARRRKSIEFGLAKGIENNELVLDFQPIENLHTGKICGVEALVRWTHPELGRIMPSEFIGVAEDAGLIEALGDWVIHHAAAQVLELHARGHKLWCAVNCSVGQLLNPEFSAKATHTIRSLGLDPKWIEFEVTESAAIDDMPKTVEALNGLKAAGASVAMDDFGTGYASLNYLRQLPVDALKIDKSFVMGLLDDEDSHKIVKAVIDLAHALELVVHAEGIETAEQRQRLIEMGCDRLQGYWFSKPLNADALLAWLETPAEIALDSNG